MSVGVLLARHHESAIVVNFLLDSSQRGTRRMAFCLGIEALGQCSYDPSNPPHVYFSIGEAIAALSITLIVPQFLKPIFRFRLKCSAIDERHIFACTLVATLMVIFATILPNLGFPADALWSYPVLWEVVAGVLFFLAITALIFPAIHPVKPTSASLERFAFHAVSYLAHATDKDRADFSDDLRRCIYDMVSKADLRRRLWKPSAFVLFAKRRQLRSSEYASGFLRVLSDLAFCRVLVRDVPWNTAHILHEIADYPSECQSVGGFVREIARQSILLDDSMFAREIGYEGFRETSAISEALFGNHSIARFYTPLGWTLFNDTKDLQIGQVARLSRAILLTVKSSLSAGDYWTQNSLGGVSDLVSSVATDICQRVRDDKADYRLIHALQLDLLKMIDETRKHLDEMETDTYYSLFLRSDSDTRTINERDLSLLDEIAEIIVQCLFSFCNDFDGTSDPFWSFANSFNKDVLERYQESITGFDPLQQRIVLKILRAVDDNLKGYYPAISRMLLSTIGPYRPSTEEHKNHPWQLFVDAFFYRLLAFPEFYKKDSAKALTYLPSDVRYIPERNCIIKTYRGGEEQETSLGDLNLFDVNINDHLREKIIKKEGI